MNAHKNARTTPYARALMVKRWQCGEAVADIASAFGVSIRTVHKWLARYRAGGDAALESRSSAPHEPGRAIGQWWVRKAE